MCVTMWYICYVANMSLQNYLLFVILPAWKHSGNSITFYYSCHIILLHVSGYYIQVCSLSSLGSKAITAVECVQFQEEYSGTSH